MANLRKKTDEGNVDSANFVTYTEPIEIHAPRPTKEDIPKELIKDCERIKNILEEESGEEVPIEMAFDLWTLHSQKSFNVSFSDITDINDWVIKHNMFSLVQNIIYYEEDECEN